MLDFLQPQLCNHVDKSFLESIDNLRPYVCERKFDGTRIMTYVSDGEVHMFTRNGKTDIANKYSDISNQLLQFDNVIFDGEFVFLDNHNNIEFQSALITPETIFSRHLRPCYIVFDVLYQNFPYTLFYFQSKSSVLPGYGTRVYVMYCAQGIVDLEYSWANYAIDGTLEEHDAAITLDQALSQVRTRYEDWVVTSAVEIENIFFQYVPAPGDETSGSCTFVPAWVFQPKTSMTVDGEVSEFYQKIVVVHAITGEVISL